MKLCTTCGVMKNEGEFYKDRRSHDGLLYECKDCRKKRDNYRYQHNIGGTRDRQKQYRQLHKERYDTYHREYSVEREKRAQELRNQLKTPCVKCGETRPWVIQFHHKDPLEKSFQITNSHNESEILVEVQKCVCLCSNCHDEFHYFFGKKPKDPVGDLERYLKGELK